MQIGVDFGGTKIEAAGLDETGRFVSRIRVPTPGNYHDAVVTVRDLVERIERAAGRRGSLGVGTPGSTSPTTGLMRNANTLYLNGRRFQEDLGAALQRPVRLANDANCFALSEATDGAAAQGRIVFGAILGTGCGGGVVVNGRLIEGGNGVGGEWGHNPLPWAGPDETPGPECYCGRRGCLEQWISGTGLQKDYGRVSADHLTAEEIVALAREGRAAAAAALDRLIHRIGRALASVCNLIDPDVIVLGGGLSNVEEIRQSAPRIIAEHVFSDAWSARIAPARWGDSSGVRGAARLWSENSIVSQA